MSRIYLGALALVLLAAAFAAGYRTGLSKPAAPLRSVTGERALVPEGVPADVREALLEPDLLTRIAALARLFQDLEPEALGEVRQAYDSVVLDPGDIDLVLLAEWWAGFDPEAAFAWTRSDWRADDQAIVLMVLRSWGRRDPEAALTKAHGLSPPNLRLVGIDSVLTGWDESGKPGLLEYVENHPLLWDRQRMAYTVARRKVLRDGAAEAFRWAEGLPESDARFKLYVFQRVAAAAAETDPRATAAFAERHAGGPWGSGLYPRVGSRWAERDPEAALRWLASLPEGSERNDGVRETYRTWLRRERERAQAWPQAQPLAPWLDPALSLYAKSLTYEAPRDGVEWALKIADDELRWPTAVTIAREWLLADEAAARAWIDQAGLPPLYQRKVFEFPPGLLRKHGRLGQGAPLPSPTPAAEAPDAAQGTS
jgi:hypothetical protein